MSVSEPSQETGASNPRGLGEMSATARIILKEAATEVVAVTPRVLSDPAGTAAALGRRFDG